MAIAMAKAALPAAATTATAILARATVNSRSFATDSSSTAPPAAAGQPDHQQHQHQHPDAPTFSMDNPFAKEKRQCILCRYQIQVDYKNTRLLSQFLSSYTGKLYDRHITGLCAKQHEIVKRELKKAQSCHYIPILHKDIRFVKDPELYDPFRPERPNPY